MLIIIFMWSHSWLIHSCDTHSFITSKMMQDWTMTWDFRNYDLFIALLFTRSSTVDQLRMRFSSVAPLLNGWDSSDLDGKAFGEIRKCVSKRMIRLCYLPVEVEHNVVWEQCNLHLRQLHPRSLVNALTERHVVVASCRAHRISL